MSLATTLCSVFNIPSRGVTVSQEEIRDMLLLNDSDLKNMSDNEVVTVSMGYNAKMVISSQYMGLRHVPDEALVPSFYQGILVINRQSENDFKVTIEKRNVSYSGNEIDAPAMETLSFQLQLLDDGNAIISHKEKSTSIIGLGEIYSFFKDDIRSCVHECEKHQDFDALARIYLPKNKMI